MSSQELCMKRQLLVLVLHTVQLHLSTQHHPTPPPSSSMGLFYSSVLINFLTLFIFSLNPQLSPNVSLIFPFIFFIFRSTTLNATMLCWSQFQHHTHTHTLTTPFKWSLYSSIQFTVGSWEQLPSQFSKYPHCVCAHVCLSVCMSY